MRNKLINYYNIFHFAVSVVFAVSFAYYTASFAGVALFVLAIINILIFLSYSRNISIPHLSRCLKNHYFTTKLSFAKTNNKKYHKNAAGISMVHFDEKHHWHIVDKIILLIHEIQLHAVEYLILLFSSSEESFHILKEAMSERHAREIKILHEGKYPVALHKVQQAIKKKQFVHWNILDALQDKLLHLHKFRQRKLKFLSSSGISVFIILGIIPTIVASSFGTYVTAAEKKQPIVGQAVKIDPTKKIEIVDYHMKKISDRKMVVGWETNIEGDSTFHYALSDNGKPDLENIRVVSDNSLNVLHELEVTDFVSGAVYDLWLESKDSSGNTAKKLIKDFSTRNMPTLSY